MACTCAPALIRFRNEVNTKFPDRDKASDGCCGDPAHAARTSDHNPTNGFAHAYDFDEDLSRTYNSLDWLRRLLYDRRDPRVKYMIYEREIWYPHNGIRSRGKYPYGGINAHLLHLHVSIFTTFTHNTDPWLMNLTPVPAPTPEDDDMPAHPVILCHSANELALHWYLTHQKRDGNADPAGKAWWVNNIKAATTQAEVDKLELMFFNLSRPK